MTPWEWLEEAVTKDFAVLDVENRFYADRNKNDIPDLPSGIPFKAALKEWESTGLGRQVKYKHDLSEELLNHVNTWQDYCYAIGFFAPGLPALIWSEITGTSVDRSVLGDFIYNLVRRVTIVAHNASHDVRIIKYNWGVPIADYKRVEDSMLAHNVLHSELPHSLNFCSGVYSTQNMHKDLGTHSLAYLHGDVRTTAEVWWNLEQEMKRDPESKKVYDTFQQPLLPHLLEAHVAGTRLDKRFMAAIQVKLEEQRIKAKEVANDFVRNFERPGKKKVGSEEWSVEPIEKDMTRSLNMNSPTQMNEWIYDICGLKIKGLRRSRKGKKLFPLRKDQIAAFQDQFLPRDDDDTFESRLAQGGHPLIEAKAEFTAADKYLSGYIVPYSAGDRVHPQFKLHGQATGRWSTTGPNIPGMNKVLKPLLIPDPGTCWVGGDWSNAELRIMAELSGDELLKRGFAEGWDLHSMHASQAFGWDSPHGRWAWAVEMRKFKGKWEDVKDWAYPRGAGWWGAVPATDWKEARISASMDWEEWMLVGGPQPGWMGDEDLLRRFCKVLVFRLMYGGGVNSAAAIPGARSLGLPEKRLVQASKDLILAHPWWEEFWRDVGDQAKLHKIVRNPNGRARRLMDTDVKARYRAGINFPIQSWVSDLLNRTILGVKARAPWAVMKYTCHDSFEFQCPLDKRDDLVYIIREEATAPLRGDFFIPFDMHTTGFDETTGKRTVQSV